MVKLVLNGCQLSTEDCNRITSTVDLSSCSGGGGGVSGDTINGLSINDCLLEIAYTDKNGVAQTKSVDISSCQDGSGDTIVDLSITDCILTLSYTDKDGVSQTKTVDISSCVPDIPPIRTCFAVEGPRTFTNTAILGPIVGKPGATQTNSREVAKIDIKTQPAGALCASFIPPSAIQYWDGTNIIDAEIIEQQLIDAGFQDVYKQCVPCLDRVHVYWRPDNNLIIAMTSSDPSCQTQILNTFATVYRSTNGVITDDYDVLSTVSSFTDPDYETVIDTRYVDGVTYYYEDGVKVTDPTRLAEIETMIAAATEANIVCCEDCGVVADGSETKITGCTGTTVTGSGTIADPYVICASTSVTDLTGFTWNSTNGATVITFTKSDGSTDTINTTILPTFVNTDNQQLTGDTTGTVLITLTPAVQPDGSTNYTIKADLKVAATTPSGGTNGLKIDASGNYYVELPTGAETKVTGCAGTTVTGTGTTADPYVICATPATGAETKVQAGTNTTVTGTGTTADPYIINATGSTPDGSETKVVAGTNTTVTGSGTTASPYVINAVAADGSETKVIAGKNTTVTGTGTTADPYVVNADLSKLGSSITVNRTADYATGGRSLAQYPFNNAPPARRIGDTSLMTLSGGGVLLQPGYRYRVTTRLQVATAVGANSWTSYILKLGATGVDGTLYMKHNGWENADSANGQQYSMYDVVDVPAAGGAQLLTLSNNDGTSASTWTFESLSNMVVEVIGVL